MAKGDATSSRQPEHKRVTKVNEDLYLVSRSVIDEMAELFNDCAGTIYHRLKDGLRIKESFFVKECLERANHQIIGFQKLMNETAEKILSYIEKLRTKGIFSVSMCFTTDGVESEKTGIKGEGFWTPYCFKSSKNSNLSVAHKPLPVRVNHCENGGWEYVVPDSEIHKQGQTNKILVGRINMPHGGISFSERFIKKIDKRNVEGEDKIIEVDDYDTKGNGCYVLAGQELNDIFNDGNEGQNENGEYIYPAANKPIQQRSQVVIIPIECKDNQNGGPKRIGYLQVTGYNYHIKNNKNEIINSDTPKTDKIDHSIILNGDEKDEIIVSILKCFAKYIVLANKIEAFKKTQTSFHYVYGNT